VLKSLVPLWNQRSCASQLRTTAENANSAAHDAMDGGVWIATKCDTLRHFLGGAQWLAQWCDALGRGWRLSARADCDDSAVSDHVEPEPGGYSGQRRLTKGDANLAKASVVNVSQVLTIDKSELVERIGKLPPETIDAIRSGLSLLFDRARDVAPTHANIEAIEAKQISGQVRRFGPRTHFETCAPD